MGQQLIPSSDIVDSPRSDVSERGADREIVGSVLKAFDVLKAFSRYRPRMTLSEVADYAGMSRASAPALPADLRPGRLHGDRRQALSPDAKDAGAGAGRAGRSQPLGDGASGDERARGELGESCFGAVLDGSDVLYMVHLGNAQRFVNVGIRVGSRLPAYCTSIGRVLLSGLSDEALEQILADMKPVQHTPKTITAKGKLREAIREARRVGWSMVDEELEIGLRSVSAPIRARSGQIIAAVNVCGPSSRVSLDDMRNRFVPEIMDAAERMNRLVRE